VNPDFIQLSLIIMGLLGGFFLLLNERQENYRMITDDDFQQQGSYDVTQTLSNVYEDLSIKSKHLIFSLNREVIKMNGLGLSLSIFAEYELMEHNDYHKHMDQLMRETVIEVAQRFVATFGTKCISDQKIALETRIRGALQAESSNWGILLKSLKIVKLSAIPKA